MEYTCNAQRSMLIGAIVCLLGCTGSEQGEVPADDPFLPGTNGARTEMPDVVPDGPEQIRGFEASQLSHEIIKAPNGTFGYEIHSDGQLVIRQINLPGMPGVEGARTREDAERLAALVIDKLRRGEMPPTVHEHELQAMGFMP